VKITRARTILALSLYCAFAPSSLRAEASAKPDLAWAVPYEMPEGWTASFNVIRQTRDGGCIVGGGRFLSIHNVNVLVKLDSAGKIEWKKETASIDGFGSEIEDIVETKTGYMVRLTDHIRIVNVKGDSTGGIESWEMLEPFADGGALTLGYKPGKNAWDYPVEYYVIRLDADGKQVWKKNILKEVDSADVIRHAVRLSDGSAILTATGWYQDDGYANRGAFIKLDPEGNVLWVSKLGLMEITDIIAITPTPDDGAIFFVRGNCKGDSHCDQGLGRLDNKGKILWTRFATVLRNPHRPFEPETEHSLALGAGGETIVAGMGLPIYKEEVGSGKFMVKSIPQLWRVGASGEDTLALPFPQFDSGAAPRTMFDFIYFRPVCRFLGVQATGDGGFVMTGAILDSLGRPYIALKVSSVGAMTRLAQRPAGLTVLRAGHSAVFDARGRHMTSEVRAAVRFFAPVNGASRIKH
jgi:hypothetical protein